MLGIQFEIIKKTLIFNIYDKNHYYALENTNLSAGNSCLGMSLCVTYPI